MHTNDLGNMHTTAEASNLYLIKPDGTGQRQLTSSSVGGLMRIAEPRWTPNGTRILVSVGIGRPDGKEATVVDVKVAFVDPTGGEPVFPETPIHGSRPDMRPTP